ncbi:MAG: DUF3786 domain-containing protein [Deltaproteobacteria bacterium]|nr:DUF3786 domain-containing protein [Deltaproteobacteria bacterium]
MKTKALQPVGYEKNYELLRARLSQADFGQRARELGFVPVDHGSTIDFLGRGYLLDSQGVRALDGQPSPANDRALLIHYILSPGQAGPGDKFITLWQTPGFIRGRHAVGADFICQPITRAFGSDLPALQKACQALGGQEIESVLSGWRRWLFRALPRISLLVDYSPPDEEFPAEARILFDDLAPTYLGFECLAFLISIWAEALAKAKELNQS